MDRDWLIRKHNDLRGWLWGLVPGLALIALLSVLGHGIWVAFFFFAVCFAAGGAAKAKLEAITVVASARPMASRKLPPPESFVLLTLYVAAEAVSESKATAAATRKGITQRLPGRSCARV